MTLTTTGPVSDWESTLIAALPHLHYQMSWARAFSTPNIGYAIFGRAAISHAAGESYVDDFPKHIFEPLGMTRSALDRNAQMLPHLFCEASPSPRSHWRTDSL